MGKMMKVLFILTSAVFFFSGCNSSDTNKGPKINGPKNSGKSRKVLDLSKMKPEERKAHELIAKDVKVFKAAMKEADSLFRQVWPLLLAENSKDINNPFQIVHRGFEQVFNNEGLKYEEKEKECKNGTAQVEISRVETAYAYDVLFTECGKNKSAIKVAEIKKQKDLWNIKFEVSNLGGWLNGLGTYASTKVANAGCNFKMNDKGDRLQALNCINLGQDVSSNKYIIMEKFIFNQAEKGMPIKIKGRIISFDQDFKESESTLIARDYPLTNEFKVQGQAIPSEEDGKKAPPAEPVKDEAKDEKKTDKDPEELKDASHEIQMGAGDKPNSHIETEDNESSTQTVPGEQTKSNTQKASDWDHKNHDGPTEQQGDGDNWDQDQPGDQQPEDSQQGDDYQNDYQDKGHGEQQGQRSDEPPPEAVT